MEFSCKACGSPAIVYPDHFCDDAPLKCRRCDIVICTLGQFRLYAERDAAHADNGRDTPLRALSTERGEK
jgi:hypothetical protein